VWELWQYALGIWRSLFGGSSEADARRAQEDEDEDEDDAEDDDDDLE
jgi:hypothetical protein